MKKILLAFLVIAAAVGGYFLVNLDWAALTQKQHILTEQQVRSILTEKFEGNVIELKFHNGQTPFYTATIEGEQETIMIEVDAISKRINFSPTTAQSQPQKSREEANENKNASSPTEETKTEEMPTLPLTKEGAIHLAQKNFEGDIKEVILVEQNGVRSYEITLHSNKERATLKINQQTGEILQNEVEELQTTGRADSVANAMNATKPNSTNKSQEVNIPSINQIETPTIASITIDQAKEIALNKVDGYIRSAQLNNQNFYEIKIVKGREVHLLTIHPTNGLIVEQKTEK